jgi:hypothetical protein
VRRAPCISNQEQRAAGAGIVRGRAARAACLCAAPRAPAAARPLGESACSDRLLWLARLSPSASNPCLPRRFPPTIRFGCRTCFGVRLQPISRFATQAAAATWRSSLSACAHERGGRGAVQPRLGGSSENNPYLGIHWSSPGYVAVFIQHPGSDESVWKSAPAAERLKAMREAASVKNYRPPCPGHSGRAGSAGPLEHGEGHPPFRQA